MPPIPEKAIGKFDDPLTFIGKGAAKGAFGWDHCYLMGVFILQSDPAKDGAAKDFGAAYGLGTVTVGARDAGDADGSPNDQVWKLLLKNDPAATRDLQAGRALATAVALIGTAAGVQLVQWSQAIELR